MAFFKIFGEIAVGLAVVMAWGYVALTLPDPARAAATVPAVTQAASHSDHDSSRDPTRNLVAQR